MNYILISIELLLVVTPLIIHWAMLNNQLSLNLSFAIITLGFGVMLIALFVNFIEAFELIHTKSLEPSIFFGGTWHSLFFVPITFILYLVKLSEIYEFKLSDS
ncbi:hypothetical protein [Vibrio atypicus]|uniref:hypothetical protein n=1 Tax=Vibrio atypicus TaxID=558271 RepID=UPI00135C2764|nr:hypothetical protein [Vibrio atypicus]